MEVLKAVLTLICGGLLGAALLALRKKEDVTSLICEHQIEAHRIGLDQGRAQGEIIGQARAFCAIEEKIRERDGVHLGEVTYADIDRAKAGLLH